MLVIPSAADSGITTLEGTTWEFKAGQWTAASGYGIFAVSFILDELDGDTSYFGDDFNNELYIGYYGADTDDFPVLTPGSNSVGLFPLLPLYVSNSQSFTITFTGGNQIGDPDLISWVTENGEQVLPNHVEPITDVFTGITTWITSALGTVTGAFYVEGTGLTFIGNLSVIGLSIALAFLLIGVIQRFLSLRG